MYKVKLKLSIKKFFLDSMNHKKDGMSFTGISLPILYLNLAGESELKLGFALPCQDFESVIFLKN